MRAADWGIGAAVLVALVAGPAHAQVTTERSASILVFPKVLSDGTRDTIIQISNTSNSMVHAHCFYVNGALTFPQLPAGPINPPLWTEVDFDIWLTKQQPTHWLVSEGRLVDATDPACSNSGGQFPFGANVAGQAAPLAQGFYACNGAGIDPGRVPPVVEYFTGELKCVEVDPTGAPVSGNHLKGEATVVTRNVCNPDTKTCTIHQVTCSSTADCDSEDPGLYDVAKYNALGILGNENNNGDGVLCLGGQVSDECPNGAEYDACPQFWIANIIAEDSLDPVDEAFDKAATHESAIETSFTFVPCTQNFETQAPETVTIFIDTFNEFEQAFSSFATVTCWDDLFLDEINPTVFFYDVLGSTFAQSRLRPSAQTQSGFLMVGEEFHAVETGENTFVSSAAVNYHIEGERPGPDLWTIPAEQINVGSGNP